MLWNSETFGMFSLSQIIVCLICFTRWISQSTHWRCIPLEILLEQIKTMNNVVTLYYFSFLKNVTLSLNEVLLSVKENIPLCRVRSWTKSVSTGLTRIGGMSGIKHNSIIPVEIPAIYVLPTKTSLLLWKYHLSVLDATIRVHFTKSVHFICCLKLKNICP